MLSFDHIVIAVNDLETAARRYRHEYGIRFQPGGIHPGGTKNWANLFPDGSYIELLAVHDDSLPSAALVRRFLERHGDRLFHWALRTDDIETVAARTGVRPDGRNKGPLGGDATTDPPWTAALYDCGMPTSAGVPYPVVTANLARHALDVGYPA